LTGLYIFIGIVLAIFLLLSVKASVKLEFKNELRVSVKILCFNIQLAPKKKKKAVKIKDYTFDKHQKRLRANYSSYVKKQKKKEEKKVKKAEEKAKKAERKKAEKESNTNLQQNRTVLDWINIARAVIGALFSKFSKRLHVKVARLKIKVATGDAASTAILYGAIVQSVAYIIEILQSVTNVDGLKNADISVEPDFLADKTSLDLCFVFSLRIRHVFGILFGAAGRAIKKLFEIAPSKTDQATPATKPKGKRVNSKVLKETK
jgi:hypothetical protein